jgi:hypothetical protein
MASNSRGRKTGTSRKASSVKPLENVMTLSGTLALVTDATADATADVTATTEDTVETAVVASILPVIEAAPAPIPEDALTTEPVKPARRRSRKAPVTDTPSDEASTASSPPRKRTRKTTKKVEVAPEPEADIPVSEADDTRSADPLAGAFLYRPELDSDGTPFAEPANVEPATADPAIAEPPTAEPVAVEPLAEAVPRAEPATVTQLDSVPAAAKVDLPFIIDIPRDVPVMDDSPADEWVERVLASSPRQSSGDDEWVDQVLEPSKVAITQRPRVRPQAAGPAAKTAPKPAPRPASRPAPTAVAKSAARAAAPRPATATAATSALAPAATTRWWLALPLVLVLALVVFVTRQGTSHAPVPAGVLGTWTTAYWLYEHQTLEIKPDTVVATLDDVEEGRFPITKVETADAGRELAVKIFYQNARGDEKEIDFLADKDPTTALRFRSHTGLVWVRAE